MSKLIIKYVRIVDNTSLESYLVQGDVYGVIEESTGDLFHYYKLDVNTPYRDGLWVSKERVEGVNGKIKAGQVSALPPMLKQKTENDLKEIIDSSPSLTGLMVIDLTSGETIGINSENITMDCTN